MVVIFVSLIALGVLGAQTASQVQLLPGNLQSVAPDVCAQIFGPPGNGDLAQVMPGLNNYSSYGFMLAISLEIILAVFILMGLMYGIGRAFVIPRVIAFVKTEYLESLLSLIIVFVLFFGMLVVAGGVNFISTLGAAVVGSSGVASQSSTGYALLSVPAGADTVQQLYQSICNVYWIDATLHFAGLVFLSGISIIYNTVSSVQFTYMPNGVGAQFGIGTGLTPFVHLLSFMTPLITGAVIVELGIIFLLAIIYYLFPLFLFSGVLLRSLPWTRAAGGTLLALFIGFYVFFPALLYPFASVDYRCLAGQQTTTTVTQFQDTCVTQWQQYFNLPAISSNPIDIGASMIGIFTNAAKFASEGQFIALMDFWIFSIINASFQIFGVVISFVISYSLLEGFADLLGAPSLTAKNLLRNLI